jgi:WhiB family redox-sensing transcriptional regulator
MPASGIRDRPLLRCGSSGPEIASPPRPFGAGATDELERTDDLSTRPAWMERAQCRGEDRDLFFPSVGTPSTKARVICSTCPVRQECLAFALADSELIGVWGGTTTQERKKLR